MKMKVTKLDDGGLEIMALEPASNGEFYAAKLVLDKEQADNVEKIAAASAACAIELARSFPSKYLGSGALH